MEVLIMNGRQSKRTHHQTYGNSFSASKRKWTKVSLISEHARFRHRKMMANEVTEPAELIILKAKEGKVSPRLPESIIVGEYKEEQVPYIEGLGWMLVYLFKRYPELKVTKGFVNEHIKCTEHRLRSGFYETHAFFTLDTTVENEKNESAITLDVTHGCFDAETSSWTIEVFEGGGFVRKFVCETPDTLVVKLVEQLNKYGLIQQAWYQSRKVN
jgi:hypothetical protein